MNTVAAREVKRRGITAVDEALAEGPVLILRRDRPSHVVLSPAQFEELREASEEACVARVRAALADVRAGRVRRVSARELLKRRPKRG